MDSDAIFIGKMACNTLHNKIMKLVSFFMIISIFGFPDNTYLAYITRALFALGFISFLSYRKMRVNKFYFLWATFFSVIGGINVFFAINQTAALRTYITTIQATWIGFMIANWLIATKAFHYVFTSVIIGGACLCVRIFNYIDFSRWGNRKVSTMLSVNVNGLGFRLAIAFLFAFLFALVCKEKVYRFIYLVFSGIFALFILITGSRRALILIVMAFCIISFMRATNPFARLRTFILIGLAIIGVYWLMMSVPQLYTIIGSRMESFFDSLLSSGSALDGGRDMMIQRSLELFSEKPVFGWGMGNFRDVSGIDNAYAHNTFVELLYATGLPGFCAYYSIFLFLLCYVKNVHKKSIAAIIMVCIFSYSFISDMASVNYTSIVMHILIAIAVSIVEEYRRIGAGSWLYASCVVLNNNQRIR